MKMSGIKANFVFNVVGPIISLAVALITVPLYVSYIGVARYGLVAIVWRLLGYFGFLDLGLARASANALAKLKDPSLGEERAKVLVTVLCINLFLGTAGALIFFFSANLFIEHFLTVPADLKPEIDTSLPWVAWAVPLALFGGLGSGALEAKEHFLTVNILNVVGSTAGMVLPVLCAMLISPSLSVVIPATVLARLFAVLLLLGFALRGEGPLTPRHFDVQRFKSLLGYGGWISVSNAAGQFLASADQLMIGSVLGVAAVAHYSVPMNLCLRSQLLAAALSRTLFPRMSRSTRHEANELAEKALVTLAYAYGAVCAAAVVMAGPFLDLWMGKEFGSVAGPIAEILLIGAWIDGLGFILFAVLDGQGRPDIGAKIRALELLPFLLVLWVLMTHFGLIGAAVAWLLMVTVAAGLAFVLARFHSSSLAGLLPPFLFILAAYLYVLISSPTFVPACVVAFIVGMGTVVCALIFDARSREFAASLRFPRRPRHVS